MRRFTSRILIATLMLGTAMHGTAMLGTAVHQSSSLAVADVLENTAAQDAITEKNRDAAGSKVDKEGKDEEAAGWKKLIDSPKMEGFESINFGGEGDVTFNDGVLKLGSGLPMTGIRYTKKDFPKENFEIRWKARRVSGSDFFVCLTFPVGEEHCSLICGGWGGGLIGISNINGNNASENHTTRYSGFKNGQWYTFRIKVDGKQVTAWVEGEEDPIVVEREGTTFSVRAESRPTRPLGYAGFESVVEVKDWEYRELEASK